MGRNFAIFSRSYSMPLARRDVEYIDALLQVIQ